MRLSDTLALWLQRVQAPLEEQVPLLCRVLGVEGFAALGPRACGLRVARGRSCAG